MYNHLFYTPVQQTNIDRELSEDELKFIHSIKDFSLNDKNYSSVNKNILESNELSELKDHINSLISLWVDDVVMPENPYLDWKITQSWLNYAETGGGHHMHKHCNSVVSGVFYLDVQDEDFIRFYNPTPQSDIEISPKEFNPYNSYTWDVEVKKGDIILFPSKVFHSVPTVKQSDFTRVSLAFNVFPFGDIGRYDQTTHLLVS
jgi:uncharacterized protein (TIGR02466 family)